MELSGRLADNLMGAIRSARRLRGHPVHRDTRDFWEALLAHARESQRHPGWEPDPVVDRLIGELQDEIAQRD
jgi:hypothetical protein